MNQKMVIQVLAFTILGCILSGCAHTGLVVGEGRSEVQVDRGEYIHQESEKQSVYQEVKSKTIDSFITEYNKAQTADGAKIKGAYKIFRYKDNPNVYYVFSEGEDEKSYTGAIAIQLNSQGDEVVMASAIGGEELDIDSRLKITNAVIDVMKTRSYIPGEQLARIARLKAEVSAMKAKISNHISEFNAKVNALDTSLPNIDSLPERDPLPQFDPDSFDPFELR